MAFTKTMNSNWHIKNNNNKKVEKEKKKKKQTNLSVNFCAVDYYSHTCALHVMVYSYIYI